MTVYSRIRAEQPGPSKKYPKLAEWLTRLKTVSDRQYKAAKAHLSGALYPKDMLLLVVTGRSLELIDAFTTEFDKWNIRVSSAMVRMQIDNLLHAHVVAITADLRSLLLHLASDRRLSRFPIPHALVSQLPPRLRKRQTLTDDVLVALAGKHHDWLPRAYRSGSAWIHHSSAHLLTTWKGQGGGIVSARIPIEIDQFSEDFLEGIASTMATTSRTILNYLEAWGEIKAMGPPSTETLGT